MGFKACWRLSRTKESISSHVRDVELTISNTFKYGTTISIRNTKEMMLPRRVRFFIAPMEVLACGLALATASLSAKTLESSPRKLEPFFNTEFILRMIAGIEQRVDGKKIKIAVGDFNYAETDMQSRLSTVLEEDLRSELERSGMVAVVSRQEISEMAKSGALSSKSLQPDIVVQPSLTSDLSAIVRGRFYNTSNGVQVNAQVTMLDHGSIENTKFQVPTSALQKRFGAYACAPGQEGVIEPQNLKLSEQTYKQVITDRLEKIPSDFQVGIQTLDGKRAYVDGEPIGFLVRSNEDCHITVLCHQSDGNSVVLFPNRWHRSTQLKANETIEIPASSSKFNLRIGPPFGSDVVEVIACSSLTEIHMQIAKKIPPTTSSSPFQVVTRGIIVEGIDSAISATVDTEKPNRRWGTDYIVVSSFPSK